jgi:DNA replication protein DnaC
MQPLASLFTDEAFLETLRKVGFTEADLAAGQARAAAVAARGPGQLGPSSTWLHDGSEYGTDLPGYRCATCHDAGWVRREVPIGHADFGHAIPCACRTTDPVTIRAQQQARIERSGLDASLLACTLDRFERVTGTEHALVALTDVLEAHRLRAERGRWAVLTGGPGRGKTHLLAAMIPPAALLDTVRWANLPDLLALMAEDGFAHADEYLRAMLEAPILILDEFGAAGAQDWARERLERLLNYRYARQMTTLLGLSVSLIALEAWSPRIASRLADTRLVRTVELVCPDYRRRGEVA